jgi:hypothetical protein
VLGSRILLKTVLNSLYNSPLKARQVGLLRPKRLVPNSSTKHTKQGIRVSNSLET